MIENININWLIYPTFAIGLLCLWAAYHIYEYITYRCEKKIYWISLFWIFSLILSIPGLAMPLHYLHLFDESVTYYEFRSIPYIELSAAMSGFLAGGILFLVNQYARVVRSMVLLAFSLGIIAPYAKSVIAPLPLNNLKDRWHQEVSMQSTRSTCGASSSATIFKQYNINMSEKQVAEQAYTYQGGTEAWYLARLFRHHGFKVTFRFENKKLPFDLKYPVIAGVRNTGGFSGTSRIFVTLKGSGVAKWYLLSSYSTIDSW